MSNRRSFVKASTVVTGGAVFGISTIWSLTQVPTFAQENSNRALSGFPASTAVLPDFEIPGQTPIHNLLEIHPTFTKVQTPFALALSSLVNDHVRNYILEESVKGHLQETVIAVLPALQGKKAGYLIRVNIYADALGNTFVPGGQFISAIGLGIEPTDALAEAFRAPAIRSEVPHNLRDVGSYVWLNRSGNRLVMSTIPDPLSREFERVAWKEKQRRDLLGGTSVTAAPESLRQVKQAEFWVQVERQRIHLINNEDTRQRLRDLTFRYKQAQLRFNDAYRSYQLAERALANQANEMAALARIKTVAALIQTGMSKLNEPNSTAATAKPPLQEDRLDEYIDLRNSAIQQIHEASAAEARAHGTTLRTIEVEINTQWNEEGVPVPGVPKLDTGPF